MKTKARPARPQAKHAKRRKPKPSAAKGRTAEASSASSAFTAQEARLLERFKPAAKSLLRSLEGEPLRFVGELIGLAFGPASLPGVPEWAREAARRFLGVTGADRRRLRDDTAAHGTAAAYQQALAATLEQEPAAWGSTMGLCFRTVCDLDADLTDPTARRRLTRLTGIMRQMNDLEARKAAALGLATEAEYMASYGVGLATDAEQQLQAADSYRDLFGIVVLKRREIAGLKSRAEFRDYLLAVLPRNRVGSDKRLEHFCRLIGLSFRRPGRPKGSANKPH